MFHPSIILLLNNFAQNTTSVFVIYFSIASVYSVHQRILYSLPYYFTKKTPFVRYSLTKGALIKNINNFINTYLNNASIKSFGSNFCKSSIFSPTPIYFTGIPSSDMIAIAIPPFAVPSSFVRIIPVTSVTSQNCFA